MIRSSFSETLWPVAVQEDSPYIRRGAVVRFKPKEPARLRLLTFSLCNQDTCSKRWVAITKLGCDACPILRMPQALLTSDRGTLEPWGKGPPMP